MTVRLALVALVALAAPARAQVVVAPVQPAVKVEPAFPAQFQDVSVGYRHEEASNFSGNGFALRAVIGVPGWIVDGEGEMSGAWGYVGDNLVGHAQISVALRLVLNKPESVRPYIVAAPLVDITRVSSDEEYAFGANAGAGVDFLFPRREGPGLVSVDLRAGQAWNVRSQEWSDWQILATVSIGAHEEPH